MKELCILVGMTCLGWVGWWIGAKVGLMTAFTLSGIGSILGVYVDWRILSVAVSRTEWVGSKKWSEQ